MTLTMNFSGLTNAELLSFGQDLDSILAPLSETIAPVYNPFQNALSRYAEIAVSAIEKQVAQQQTEALAGADDTRDGLFRGVKYLVQAYLLHPNEAKREAAAEIEKSVAKVGWNLHRESYDEQSALMRTLLSELENKHAERLALLGMTEYVAELKARQTGFDSLRQEQLEHQAEMESISSMTAERGSLEQACKDLLEILPGYYRMTGDEALGTALPKISELINRKR